MREKPDPITDSEEREKTYQVWVQHVEGDKHWYCRRHGFETLKAAKQYIKQHTKNYLFPKKFKVVKSEINIKLTVID